MGSFCENILFVRLEAVRGGERRWEALRGGERRVVTADTLQRYKRTLRVDLPARMCEDLAKCMQIFLRTAPYMPAPKRTHSSAYSGLVAQAGY